jgi:hypothetical protein
MKTSWYTRCIWAGMQRILAILVLLGLAVLAACSGATQAPPTPTTVAKPASTTAPAVAASASPATVASASPAGAAAAASVSPAVAASASPATATALPPPTTPTALPVPPATATAVTGAPNTVWIANTDGGGVFLRNAEHEGDRTDVVLADRTPLTVTGDEVEGDGQRWYPVKTADNRDGFVQVIYTTRTPPPGPPEAPRGEPK